MKFSWIDRPEELADFCSTLGDGPVAVDTESDHYHAYQAHLCLIQVATPQRGALIDPLAMTGEEMAPLFDLLSDEGVLKVVHAGQNDIIELHRDYGALIKGIFDTQIAARFLGYQRSSLDGLLEGFFDVAPGPNFQRFDWTQRPLPEEAAHYAAQDVVHLFRLRERLEQELREQAWRGPFEEYCAYITESARHEERPFDVEGWRRLRGVDRLDGKGRAVLQAAYLWRHEVCERTNRAAFLVIPNHGLMSLARAKPGSVDELRSLRGIPRELRTDQARELIQVMKRAQRGATPPKRLQQRGPYSRPTAEEEERFHALRRWRNASSKELDIPSEFIATNDTLWALARRPPAGVGGLGEFPEILPWHQELFGRELLSIIG